MHCTKSKLRRFYLLMVISVSCILLKSLHIVSHAISKDKALQRNIPSWENLKKPTDLATQTGKNLTNNQTGHGQIIREDKNQTTIQFSNCPEPQFSKKSLQPIALASYQGSGNTWLRHLIQEATGIHTGSPYKDPHLMKGGFPGEGHTKNDVVVVKTHGAPTSDGFHFQKAIILIRNPFQAILAEFNRHNRINANEHMNLAPDRLFVEEDWHLHVYRTAANIFHFYNLWLDHPHLDRILVTYENLQTNLLPTMRRIIHFLDVPVTEAQYACMLRKAEGNFHRKKERKQPAVYSKDAIELIQLQTQLLNKKILKRFNQTVECEVPR